MPPLSQGACRTTAAQDQNFFCAVLRYRDISGEFWHYDLLSQWPGLCLSAVVKKGLARPTGGCGKNMMHISQPSTIEELQTQITQFQSEFTGVEKELAKVIVGHQTVIRQMLLCLFTGGHVLLEGVPGLGKTLLVRTLAQVLNMRFSRIQFTPDLMPADIIGTSILVTDTNGQRTLQFQPGPIFGNLILADEINRATPKTQSALLEAMGEGSVSVARNTHRLENPFFVLATQNPLEMEGTYPLPEAQLDRFAMKILVELSSLDELTDILARTTGARRPEALTLLNAQRVEERKQLVRSVPAAVPLQKYIGRLILATHPQQADAPKIVRRYVRYGSSPRGAQNILLAAKAMAVVAGRTQVSLEDIQAIAKPVLRHRLILNFDAQADGISSDKVITEVGDSLAATI